MTDQTTWDEPWELTPRIVVFGVGGAGGNAINNMIAKDLEGVDFVAANTDAQALRMSQAPRRIQMGAETTKGLGAGARPDIGSQAAVESEAELRDALQGANMCFVTAGMGGGTGTGAAPIIAKTAREAGVLTVGVVTKPFAFEGARRMRLAEKGLEELQAVVDTLIVIPNQNLFRVANERTSFSDAFVMADDVLYQGVKGVTDLMVRPGLVNLDFADVRAVMDEMGKAMMGSGEAEGERRAIEAAERAIDNPLLDEVSLKGARGVLINITGGPDMKLFEVDEAANLIRKEADPDAAVFFGSALDPTLEGRIRVSVVATGIEPHAAHDGVEAAAAAVSAASAAASATPYELVTKKAPEPASVDKPSDTITANDEAAVESGSTQAEPDQKSAEPSDEPVSASHASEPSAPVQATTSIESARNQTPEAPLAPGSAEPVSVSATPVQENPAPVAPQPPVVQSRDLPEPVRDAIAAAGEAIELEAPATPAGAHGALNAAATTQVVRPVEAPAPQAQVVQIGDGRPEQAAPTRAEPEEEVGEPVSPGDMHRVEIPSFLRRSLGS